MSDDWTWYLHDVWIWYIYIVDLFTVLGKMFNQITCRLCNKLQPWSPEWMAPMRWWLDTSQKSRWTMTLGRGRALNSLSLLAHRDMRMFSMSCPKSNLVVTSWYWGTIRISYNIWYYHLPKIEGWVIEIQYFCTAVMSRAHQDSSLFVGKAYIFFLNIYTINCIIQFNTLDSHDFTKVKVSQRSLTQLATLYDIMQNSVYREWPAPKLHTIPIGSAFTK